MNEMDTTMKNLSCSKHATKEGQPAWKTEIRYAFVKDDLLGGKPDDAIALVGPTHPNGGGSMKMFKATLPLPMELEERGLSQKHWRALCRILERGRKSSKLRQVWGGDASLDHAILTVYSKYLHYLDCVAVEGVFGNEDRGAFKVVTIYTRDAYKRKPEVIWARSNGMKDGMPGSASIPCGGSNSLLAGASLAASSAIVIGI